MRYIISLRILAIAVTACARLSLDPNQDPGTCLQGSVASASAACYALSLAYAGQIYFSNTTDSPNYTAEADGKAI